MFAEIGTFLIAALLLFGIYKIMNALYTALPESPFRTFILSPYGNVLNGVLSLIILYGLFVFVAVAILDIRC
ncbi:hypothetical protein D0C36_02400 [Mucilaginibacter conchicola]|uniref:YggT family protein n=1 Tax=Mucilaginibacter conchicola TaxID=2303333 RepID=A0A372NWD1_9SPHI|nr:hypothetical protein [Mucilaginibacter conchicola]RFZ94423.1 hypothetical protein D0C36_02400 [Mucilaginibacter conchicola]